MPHEVQPFHMRQREEWASDQVEKSHIDALFAFGEYAIFVLLWNVLDHNNGLVERCPVCYTGHGKIAEAYGQSATKDCLECYGTGYEGGYRARIVRPVVFGHNPIDSPKKDRRGVVTKSGLTSIETTADFTLHSDDLLLRYDNARYRIGPSDEIDVQTGFGSSQRRSEVVSVNFGTATLEDRNSWIYSIPPPASSLTVLSTPVRFPGNFAALEDLRGPLVVV